MSWAAVAVGVGSAVVGSQAAKKAGQGQSEATGMAIGEQRRQYDQTRADLAPYQAAGTSAITRVSELLGLGRPTATRTSSDLVSMIDGVPTLNPKYANDPAAQRAWSEVLSAHNTQLGATGYTEHSDPNWIGSTVAGRLPETAASSPGMSSEQIMEMDPGYQFRLNEGLKAGRNIAGARGMLNSGSTGKALTRYGQDYASNEFGNIYNRLMGVAGGGQNATNTGASSGANMANNVGGLVTSGANARGAAGIAGANAWGNAFDNIGSWWNQNQTLDKILNKGNTGMTASTYNSMAPS